MREISIPFQKRFITPIVFGEKCATIRTSQIAKPGDLLAMIDDDREFASAICVSSVPVVVGRGSAQCDGEIMTEYERHLMAQDCGFKTYSALAEYHAPKGLPLSGWLIMFDEVRVSQ